MDKITKLACLALLLVCSNNVSASLIFDTSATADDDIVALNHFQWLAGRFSSKDDVTLTGPEGLPGRSFDGRFEMWLELYTGKPFNGYTGHFEDDWHEFIDHHPGNLGIRHHRHVPAVPVPAALWLFGSGLIVLIGFARKKA